MTYIITPNLKAVKLPDEIELSVDTAWADDSFAKIGHVVNLWVNDDWIEVSPRYTILDETEGGNWGDGCEDLADAEFYAVEWMKDFLVATSKNPIVLECTSDGELFPYGI
jgi:hypothetical protein